MLKICTKVIAIIAEKQEYMKSLCLIYFHMSSFHISCTRRYILGKCYFMYTFPKSGDNLVFLFQIPP